MPRLPGVEATQPAKIMKFRGGGRVLPLFIILDVPTKWVTFSAPISLHKGLFSVKNLYTWVVKYTKIFRHALSWKPDKKCVLVFSAKTFSPHLELPQALNWAQTFEILAQMGKKFRCSFYTWVPRVTEFIGRHGRVWKNWAARLVIWTMNYAPGLKCACVGHTIAND